MNPCTFEGEIVMYPDVTDVIRIKYHTHSHIVEFKIGYDKNNSILYSYKRYGYAFPSDMKIADIIRSYFDKNINILDSRDPILNMVVSDAPDSIIDISHKSFWDLDLKIETLE